MGGANSAPANWRSAGPTAGIPGTAASPRIAFQERAAPLKAAGPLDGRHIAFREASHADCFGAGAATPLMSSHRARATSYTNAGNHMSQVTDDDQLVRPPSSPARCSGRITTSRTDAST